MDYRILSEDNFYAYRDVILPDIRRQLLETPSFEEAGIACIGAEENGQAAGAAVIGFRENAEAVVLSLYVSPEFRNRGVGSELVSRMIARVLQSYEFEDGRAVISVTMEYTVPQEDAEQFGNFLSKNHFLNSERNGRIYVVPAESCKRGLDFSAGKNPAVNSLAEISGKAADEAADFLMQKGFQTDPEYCFVKGNPRNPLCLLSAEYGAGQDFYVSSAALQEKVTEADCRALLTETVRRIGKAYPEFVLIAEDIRNIYPDIWEQLAGDGGEIYVHGIAVFTADFS